MSGKNEQFIRVIQEVFTSVVSQASMEFIQKLDRPLLLEDGRDSVKLFATNGQADDFNRDMLLKIDGPVYKYISQDRGKIAWYHTNYG